MATINKQFFVEMAMEGCIIDLVPEGLRIFGPSAVIPKWTELCSENAEEIQDFILANGPARKWLNEHVVTE